MEKIILEGISVDKLLDLIRSNSTATGYDSKIGFSKKKMMAELEIKSENTFWERVRKGKIIQKEIGGSRRYFFPKYERNSNAESN